MYSTMNNVIMILSLWSRCKVEATTIIPQRTLYCRSKSFVMTTFALPSQHTHQERAVAAPKLIVVQRKHGQQTILAVIHLRLVLARMIQKRQPRSIAMTHVLNSPPTTYPSHSQTPSMKFSFSIFAALLAMLHLSTIMAAPWPHAGTRESTALAILNSRVRLTCIRIHESASCRRLEMRSRARLP
jgi:hypothetical protein